MTNSTASQTAALPTVGTQTADAHTADARTADARTADIESPARLNFAKAAPKAFRALIGLDAAAREGLDPALVELVQIRASQLNGCAYCLHMHTTDARKAGESEERLHMVQVWRDARHFFSPPEQAALALTEEVTRIAGGIPDAVYAEAAAHFDEPTLARLLAIIFTINTWNRIAISTLKVAGTDERRG